MVGTFAFGVLAFLSLLPALRIQRELVRAKTAIEAGRDAFFAGDLPTARHRLDEAASAFIQARARGPHEKPDPAGPARGCCARCRLPLGPPGLLRVIAHRVRSDARPIRLQSGERACQSDGRARARAEERTRPAGDPLVR